MMNDLWKKRQQNYQSFLLKYSKYVLNDHFIIALLFFAGGLALAYSHLVKNLPNQPFWWEIPVVILALLFLLQFGRSVTLLQAADIVFLSPLEYQLPLYLQKAFRYSFARSGFIQILGWIVILPLIVQGLHWSNWLILLLLGQQLLLKYCWQQLDFAKAYQPAFAKVAWQIGIHWLLPLGCLTLLIWGRLPISLLIVIAGIFYLNHQIKLQQQAAVFSWKLMINLEEQRLQGVYRLINLFIDVPQIKGKVRRLHWFDRWLPSAQKTTNGFEFLFSRSFLRRSEYSGLYLRLILLMIFLNVIFQNNWLQLAVILIGIYLIGFQLFPLFSTFEENVFVHLYPISAQQQTDAFSKLLQRVLVIALLIGICSGQLAKISIENLIWQLLLGLVEIWIISKPFWQAHLRKNA